MAEKMHTDDHTTSATKEDVVGPKLTFSFAAAGWLQMYHFGVGKALQDTGVVDSPDVRLVGTSAGSLAASVLALGVDCDRLRDYSVQCSNHARSKVKHAFLLRDYILGGVQRFAETTLSAEPHLKESLNSRLEVYATVLPWCKSKKFSACFETPEDVGEALAASCCLTPIAGFPFRLRQSGEWVCDGGLTNFQPRAGEENVVTVNALYTANSADIKPSTFIPVWWGLYPPAEEEYRAVYDAGYDDALRHLIKAKMIDEAVWSDKLRRSPTSTPRSTASARTASGRGILAHPLGLVKDFLFVAAFLLLFRPVGMFLIYAELLIFGMVTMVLAVLHHVADAFWSSCDFVVDRIWPASNTAVPAPSPKHKGRDHGQHAYHSARNLTSFRTWLYLILLGDLVPINSNRLEKTSLLYRLLRPVLYERSE